MKDTLPHRQNSPAPVQSASLEWRLPMLMTTVLVAVVLASLLLTYATLSRGAEQSAQERMEGAVRQLAATVNGSLQLRARRLREIAADADVERALRAGSAEGLVAVIGDDLTDNERTWPTVLLDPAGAVLYTTAPFSPGAAAELARLVRTRSDSIRFGAMFVDSATVYFWAIGEVRRGDSHLGHVAQLRRVGGPREAAAALRGLIGDEVAMYVRNADNSVWIAAPGTIVDPPTRRDTTEGGIRQVRRDLGPMIGVEAGVGPPWVVSLETPVAVLHAHARRTAAELSAISLVLAALGAFAAWMLSRGITRPISELSRAAQAVARGDYGRRVRIDRDDEIGVLAESFDSMAAEVEAGRRELERRVAEADQANRTKSDFLAVMSHELRTPLNAIGGYTQLLDLEVYGPLTPPQRDAIARLERSQAHLLRLINNVLSFSRVASGQLEYAIEPVRIDDALSELEDLVAPQIRARGITFVHEPCGDDVTAAADREKFQQIVLNLLTNAIKFTPEGGEIRVRCAVARDSVSILVSDTGCGIDGDVLPGIFDPFVQANRSLHQPNEGVGLGLAIARDLARGMGGDLTVSSEVGTGSIFTVTLPVESPHGPRYMHPVASTGSHAARS